MIYVPIELFLALGIVVATLLVGIIGLVRLYLRRRSNPDRSLARPAILWCTGVVGSLYWTISLLVLFSVMAGRTSRFEAPEIWAAVCAIVGMATVLPSAIIERRKPSYGAMYLAVAAAVMSITPLMLFSDSYDNLGPYVYGWTMVWTAVGLLIPQWIACLAMAATLLPRERWQISLRNTLLAIGILALPLGTAGVVLRRGVAELQALDRRMSAEAEMYHGRVLAARQALDDFLAAAEAGDRQRMERAKQSIIVLRSELPSEYLASRLTASGRKAVRLELLRLLRAESMPRPPYHVPSLAPYVHQLVSDGTEDIEVRQAAVQLLMYWGDFRHLSNLMGQAPDRSALAETIGSYLADHAGEAMLYGGPLSDLHNQPPFIQQLPTWFDDPADAVPALVSLVELPENSNPTIALLAAETLGNMGPVAAQALPTLRAMANSPYPVREHTADTAIQRIQGDVRQSDPASINHQAIPWPNDSISEAAREGNPTSGRLPDLQVLEVFLHKDKYLRARVSNQGSAGTTRVAVRFESDGETSVYSRPGLAAGQTVVASSNPRRPGTHRVRVTIDPDNVVAESDETNNTLELNLTWPKTD